MALHALSHARETCFHGPITNAIQHLALLRARRDPQRAARLAGYVDHVLSKTGYKRELTENYTRELLTERLRETLADEEVAALTQSGSILTEDQAVRLARA